MPTHSFFMSMYINRFRICLEGSSILLLNVHLEMWHTNRFHSTFAGDLLLCKNGSYMKNCVIGFCLLGVLVGVLTACEKNSNRTSETDAAVRVCITDASGTPVPDVEVGVYTSELYEMFQSDATVAPLLKLRTDKKGEAGIKLDRRTWFVGTSTAEIYFVFIQSVSPSNYQYWSAGGTVKAGETRRFSIVAELLNTSENTDSDFLIDNGVLIRYQGKADEVVLPSEIKEIANRCFAESNIRRVKLNEGLEKIGAFAFYNSSIEEVSFPSTLKKMGEHAFEDCIRLLKVDLGRTSLIQIPDAAFWGAGLAELLLPESLQQIDDQAFLDTKSLQTLVLPEAVVRIGMEAFRDSGLEKVQLSNRLNRLGERAFYNCFRLKDVRSGGKWNGQSGVMEVGCFENCVMLENIELPSSLVELKGWTFIGCNRLTAVTVPERVVKIGYDGLDGGNVSVITFQSIVPPALDRALPAYEYVESIYVPEVSVQAYKEKYPVYAGKIKAIG